MWRTLSLVIIGFWLVMTSLLVRYVWFPEGTNFAEVPPRMVVQQFLEQGSAMGTNAGTLHIYRREQKIGQANISCRRSRGSAGDFALSVNGTMDKGAFPNVEGEIHWGFTLKLLEVDRFGELKGNLRFARTNRGLEFLWQRGQRMPHIRVRGGDEAQVNDAVIQAMVTQMIGGGAATVAEGLGASPGAEVASLIKLKAREHQMDFAGQKSKGYLLEFLAMDRWKARAFITEAGELALVDLPDGHRLVEPVIHGLARDYDAEDAAEAAAEAAKAAAGSEGSNQ